MERLALDEIEAAIVPATEVAASSASKLAVNQAKGLIGSLLKDMIEARAAAERLARAAHTTQRARPARRLRRSRSRPPTRPRSRRWCAEVCPAALACAHRGA
jgi:hypothetical protein